MEKFLDVLLDSALDTAKILPILFIVYFLIEFMEYKNVLKFENSRLLKGKASPVMGALFGSVPQCGFSVVSAELYSERKISVGALIAVFMATSDEALPIMISNYKAIPSLLCLIATKIILSIIVGYISMLIYSRLFNKITKSQNKTAASIENKFELHSNKSEYTKTINHIDENDHHDEHNHGKHEANKDDEHHKHKEHIHACCNHDLEDNKFDWKHPLIHCLKITLYIFIINLIFGTIIMFVHEDNLVAFLNSSKIFQPLFAILIGLIPNCVSSVVITELYLMGGLSFGSIIAGLSVNAGIGLIVLLKENKNRKENIFIILTLIISSLIIGYALHFIPINLI